MTTLADIRTRIRRDLHDTDSGSYRWPDAQLDRHIERALDEVSLAIPDERSADVATTTGSYDLSLAALTGLVAVEEVEYPLGRSPRCVVPFACWAAMLTLEAETPPAGDDATTRYTARHTLDTSGSTLPPLLEDLVVTGAGAYAVLEQSAAAIDQLNTGGEAAADRYAAWARARLIAFRQLLMQHGRNHRVRSRVLRSRG